MMFIYLTVALVMGLSVSRAVHEKNEMVAHPKTWKGEMLMPPPSPTPTVTPEADR